MLNIPFDLSASPNKRFAPANRCIYCGAADSKLGDEHVVPFAIAGDAAILPKASCQPCADINNKVEGPMHRRQLKELRAVVNAPTRRPKERPEKLSIGLSRFATFVAGEQASYLGEAEVVVANFPVAYATLHLDRPGIIAGFALGTPLVWNIWHHSAITEETNPFKGNANAARIGSINPYLTAQYLARIAYAYAVAEVGVGAFTPLALDLITGRTNFFRHWVGGELVVPPAEPALMHMLSRSWVTVRGVAYLIVTLRLFCYLGTPVHHVVVGCEKGPLAFA